MRGLTDSQGADIRGKSSTTKADASKRIKLAAAACAGEALIAGIHSDELLRILRGGVVVPALLGALLLPAAALLTDGTWIHKALRLLGIATVGNLVWVTRSLWNSDSAPDPTREALVAFEWLMAFGGGPSIAFWLARVEIENLVSTGAAFDRLLPSQKSTLKEVEERIRSADPGLPQLIALTGNWGAGKTTILEAIGVGPTLRTSDKLPGMSIVRINAWRESASGNRQTGTATERQVFNAIAHEWSVFCAGGWRVHPTLFSLIHQVFHVAITAVVNAIAVLKSPNHRAGRALIPRITRSYLLVSIARQLRKSGRRLVICIDEVDRCTPLFAQSMLSLVIRFLWVENISIVMPLVIKAIDWKVFNPYQRQLPDFAHNTNFALWTTIHDAIGSRDVATNQALEKIRLNLESNLRKPSDAAMSDAFRNALNEVSQLPAAIRNELLQTMRTLANEKFLSAEPIRLRPMTRDEIIELVQLPGTIWNRILNELGKRSGSAEAYRHKIVKLIVERVSKAGVPGARSPTIRHFLGVMNRAFGLRDWRYEKDRARAMSTVQLDLDTAQYVTFVVLAWRVASGMN